MSTPAASDALAGEDADDVVVTGEAVALDLRPTGFVLAAAGAIIDWIVYFWGGLFLLLAILIPVVSGPLGEDQASLAAIVLGSAVIVFIVIPMTVETLSRGKSLGRLAVGARIVRDDGGAIGFRHAFIRSLIGLLELYTTFGGLAALTGLLNDRSKRLGDFVAGTYSQNERVSLAFAPVFGIPTVLLDWGRTADVAPLPDPVARRIAQFLQQAPRLVPASRTRLAAELAAEAAPFVSPLPQADPELFLAAITSIRRDRELESLRLGARRLELLGPALTGLPHRFPKRG